MAVTVTVASDVAQAALTFYVRGKALAQTIQDKPLLGWLKGNSKTFPGGKDNISLPIQGAFMADSVALQGYSGATALTFGAAANIQRCAYAWKELHYGLWITWTELKMDGITITDSQKTSEHSRVELTRLTGILQNRLDDFTESYSRLFNTMLWKDGTQDANLVPGVTSILNTSGNNALSVGGVDPATYTWWKFRTSLNIASSPENQTLSKKFRSEVRQLRRYGGRPNKIFAGSALIEAAEAEITEKGQYTVEGFTKGDATDLGVADIRMKGVGTFDYDPTLDDLGLSKFAFFLDSRRMRLMPMEGEDNKILKPERPYDYLIFLQSMTWTGGLVADQLNCHGVYSCA